MSHIILKAWEWGWGEGVFAGQGGGGVEDLLPSNITPPTPPEEPPPPDGGVKLRSNWRLERDSGWCLGRLGSSYDYTRFLGGVLGRNRRGKGVPLEEGRVILQGGRSKVCETCSMIVLLEI